MHGDFWRLFFYLFRIQDFLGFRLLLGYSEGIFQRSLKSLHGHFRFIQVTSGALENVGYIWEGRGGFLEDLWDPRIILKGFLRILRESRAAILIDSLNTWRFEDVEDVLRDSEGVLKGFLIYFRCVDLFQDHSSFWRFLEIFRDSLGFYWTIWLSEGIYVRYLYIFLRF